MTNINNSDTTIGKEQWRWIVLVLCLAFFSLTIRLRLLTLDLSIVGFVAVPTVLAVIVLLSGRPATLEGRYFKQTALWLLSLGILTADKFAFVLILTPFAMLVAYLMARIQDRGKPESAAAAGPTGATSEQERIRRKKLTLLGICLSFTVVSIAGRLIYMGRLETTSLMFIGVPSLLAILLVLTVRPKSAMGTIMAGITFVLLLSSILFGEGMICILMAAPIFYAMGAIIGAIIVSSRPRKGTVKVMFAMPLLLMSFEGSFKRLELPREQSVTSRAVVAANVGQVTETLAGPMRFRTELPVYLTMGFPRPVSTVGSGVSLGDRRIVHFAGGEGKPGDLVMEVSETGPGKVVFRAVSDHSKIAHWLHWEKAVVSWQKVDDHHTEVTWSLQYRRNLDPAWYFAPWERYGVGLAANYLIDNLATPARTFALNNSTAQYSLAKTR